MHQKNLEIISQLRINARFSLTEISRRTNIPVSTLFGKIKKYEGGLIERHTALINFSMLGFSTRANIIIKVDRNKRGCVKEYLSKHPNVNSVFKVNNGFDFLFEAVFRNMMELESFMEAMDEKFSIKSKQIYHIIEDIKREGFMAEPVLVNLV